MIGDAEIQEVFEVVMVGKQRFMRKPTWSEVQTSVAVEDNS